MIFGSGRFTWVEGQLAQTRPDSYPTAPLSTRLPNSSLLPLPLLSQISSPPLTATGKRDSGPARMGAEAGAVRCAWRQQAAGAAALPLMGLAGSSSLPIDFFVLIYRDRHQTTSKNMSFIVTLCPRRLCIYCDFRSEAVVVVCLGKSFLSLL